MLAEVEELGLRVERMLAALHVTKAKLTDALRTKSSAEDAEKRKKKVRFLLLSFPILSSVLSYWHLGVCRRRSGRWRRACWARGGRCRRPRRRARCWGR